MNSFFAEVWQAYQELLLGSVAREDSYGHVETIKELSTIRQGSVGYCKSLLISEIKSIHIREELYLVN